MEIDEFVDTLPTYNQKFDIVVAALGAEARATNIADKYNISGQLKVAIICKNNNILSFYDNKNFFVAKGFLTIIQADFFVALAEYARNLISETIDVALDISCMPRQLMAEIVHALSEMTEIRKLKITFCYSLACFTSPTLEIVPNEAIEPVTPSFSGWPSEQSMPTSLITGIGYEPEKAEGASEYLDPTEQWGFIPLSPILEFLTEVEKNNISLITRLTNEGRVIKYDLAEPSRTFGQLEIVISDLLRRTNPILLPFGPKIFFALCLLQSIRHPEVGVWHVTGESNEEPVDRAASGIEIGFQVTLT